MTNIQKFDIIKNYILFQGLPQQELDLLAQHAKEKVFPKHTLILQQDKPAESILLIYKGLIIICLLTADGKTIPIRTRGPQYVIGELNLVDDESTATVETLQETHALELNLQECKRLLLTYPIFGCNLAKIVIEKLRALDLQTEYYVSTPLRDRTWTILRDMAPHFPNQEITLSHEELGNVVGATRARITEVLNELEKEHLINLAHRKIHVL